MAKKLSTAEILAQLRAQKGGGEVEESAETPEAASESTPDAPVEATEEPAAPAETPAAPAAKPGSTNDILAALRAQQKGGGAAKPAEEPEKQAAAKPAAPAGKPGSTADILAALRAQKGKGGEAAPAAEPAKPKKAAATAATLPDGEKPSVLEMIRAARGDAPAATSAAKVKAAPAKPSLPPMPKKPPVTAKKKAEVPRRNALAALVATPFAAAWTMFTATATAATLGVARFMMPNVLVEPPSTFKVGPPSDFPPGTVSTKFKAQFGVWLVNSEYEGQQLIYALSSVCTHLGCTPNWLEGEQKFKCPCHGSGFYITGINFEGPAPRPLERHGITVAPDGMLEVDKGRKFQQELGQWEDAASQVEVA